MDIKTIFVIAALSLIVIYALLGFSYTFQQVNNGTMNVFDDPSVNTLFDKNNLSNQMQNAYIQEQNQKNIFVNQSRTDTNVFSFSQIMESIFTIGSVVTAMANIPASVLEGMFGVPMYITNLILAIVIVTFIILSWRAFRGN